MPVCSTCGAEFENKSKPFKHCVSCRKVRLEKGWKKQMRFYGLIMAAGVLLLAYAIPEFRGQHYSLNDAPQGLLLSMVAGGLAVLGGMFGFALAIFFHIWHGKPKQ